MANTAKEARRTQRTRNKRAERREHRLIRAQRLATAQRLPSAIRENLLLRGLARPATSVRGQLLEAVLSGAVFDEGRWIFDGSIRDLADGGLRDGRKHSFVYLLNCMCDFVQAGILERLEARRGRPVVYAVRTE